MFVLHLLIFAWLIRIEVLLFRIQRMGEDVSLVESLLRCWAVAGEWSPEMRGELLAVLRRHDDTIANRRRRRLRRSEKGSPE